uniref:Uncharacterized protein n=1 Tax=Candidatus Kentrum sp. DK TaxID=2126562 RepID=A0A450SNT2_9GAMM|nr:MAG: hypothetical protein BECKDK2373C_GA0170839_10498 [Candidatus Kentron sp. DK]VFJ57854.1 MAG: hypothetical protein BECKDK2373B_GA0170837_106842 [Candidatus Kentron sp. DK]
MTGNKDFHSVEFFRKVREKHASLLYARSREEIIAFFQDKKISDKRPVPFRESLPGVIARPHRRFEAELRPESQ